MVKRPDTRAQRIKRHKRVRAKISGTPEIPRLDVFRSNSNIYAQIIDDVNGVTPGLPHQQSKRTLRVPRATAKLPLKSESLSQNAQKLRVLKTFASTEAATFTTVASKHWQTEPVRAV